MCVCVWWWWWCWKEWVMFWTLLFFSHCAAWGLSALTQTSVFFFFNTHNKYQPSTLTESLLCSTLRPILLLRVITNHLYHSNPLPDKNILILEQGYYPWSYIQLVSGLLSKHSSGSLMERGYGQYHVRDNLFLATVMKTPTVGMETYSWHGGLHEEAENEI